MSSTQDINSFNDEVTQINTLKEDFADIRRQLEELRLKIGKRNGNQDVAIPVQETMVVDETTPVPSGFQQQSALVPKLDLTKISSNNKKNVVDSRILLNSAREKFKNFDPERNGFDKNDLHLLANIVANRHDEVQDYLTLDQKNKIKGFAESRLKFLNKNPKVNESEIGFLKDALRGEYQEYKHRDDVTTFSPVSTDRSISVSPLVTPRSRSNSPLVTTRSTSSSPSSTPRPQVKQAWKGGKKTRKTRHRMTKRRRTNKKSRTHKKRH